MRVFPDFLVNHFVTGEGLLLPHCQEREVPKIGTSLAAQVHVMDNLDYASSQLHIYLVRINRVNPEWKAKLSSVV
jgi:hypothetical protein